MTRGAREAWGRWAEGLAAWSLRLRGYRIVARRFRTPLGEIDLIAQRGRLVAFVEVKARTDLEQALVALTVRQRFDLVTVRPWRLPRHLADAWRLS